MSKNVFISKPTTLTETQSRFWQELSGILQGQGLNPRSLGTTDFPNKAPLTAVRDVMRQCSGIVVLGLKQLHVKSGVDRPGTKREKVCKNVDLPTPWNHLESGMAFILDLPMLIIREEGVRAEGILDTGASDRFIHEVHLPHVNWLSSPEFRQPFQEWLEEVLSQ